MRLFGLIGYPLSQSFSPGYFNEKFRRENIDAEYRLFPLENIDQFPGLVQSHPELDGINITIPYKEKIIPYLHTLDPLAEAIGAVNCIRFDEGKFIGFNTDAVGFRDSIAPLLQPYHTAALILGTGGASKAIKYILEEAGLRCLLVSRDQGEGRIQYQDLDADIMNEFSVIVNTTPVGMYPNDQNAPGIPYELLTPQHLLYDVIYNPAETLFLKKGKGRGAVAKNGHEMLLLQADGSWKIWNRAK